jgi:hypothetical protein
MPFPDTENAHLLMALQPEAFQKCFQDWVANAIATEDDGPNRTES